MEGAPSYDRSCWFDIKYKLGLDFPNLPYFVDGDVKITHSNAILRHIARKHDMCGKTAAEKAHVDMMADSAMDLRNSIAKLAYHEEYVRIFVNTNGSPPFPIAHTLCFHRVAVA